MAALVRRSVQLTASPLPEQMATCRAIQAHLPRRMRSQRRRLKLSLAG